jgi:5-methyltetrahydropteroyltriglutamate--homocysteine methyltransferase
MFRQQLSHGKQRRNIRPVHDTLSASRFGVSNKSLALLAPDYASLAFTNGRLVVTRRKKREGSDGMSNKKIVHADTVGSLLRPSYLLDARKALEDGVINANEFKRIEDCAVDAAIALQEGVGLDVVSDGELRRFSFFDHLMGQIEGVEDVPGVGVTFHGEKPDQDWDYKSPVTVVDKIRRKRMMTVEEYSYARAVARRPVKSMLPSPVLLYIIWSPEHSRDAYPDPYELFADGARLMREEAQELARLGCTYIQIDAPDLGSLVDPENRSLREAMGMPTERTLSEGIDIINSVADVPGVTFGLHLCKGNYQGKWIATGGYEMLAETVFRRANNIDVFLLEYDDPRSGSFEPLAQIPDDKNVVLGLVSSKRPELESIDSLVKRVDEAARYFPKEQMAISTQCGFASVVIGANPIDETVQEAKLKLVGDVADKVWG